MNKIKLGKILNVKRGTSLSSEYYSECGEKKRLTLGNFNYPYGGFKDNTSKQNIFFIGEVKEEYILKKGDIITPLTEQVVGLLGETARIPEDDKYIQSGDIGLVIPDEKQLDKSFAYYLIASPIVKRQLSAGAQQTKIRHTSPDKIKDCEVWLPNINHQRKTGALLDFINSKIELNNKINTELEAMAKTIYDYWFLQFEFPNEEGKPYKSSGGKMVWNEELKREIPEGWEVTSLDSFGTLIMGQSPKSNSYNNNNIGLPLINGAAELQKDKIEITKYTSEPNRICTKGDLIFCIRATIGNINYADKSYCLGRGVGAFHVTSKEYNEYMFFVLSNLLNVYNNTLTGSIIVGITKDDLLQQGMVNPPKDIIMKVLLQSFKSTIK